MDNASSRRTLALYLALTSGETMNFDRWHQLPGNTAEKSQRVFERDISIVRATIGDMGSNQEVVCVDNEYRLVRSGAARSLSDAVALAEVIINSRAVPKEALARIIGSLEGGFDREMAREFRQMIAPALGSYIPITHATNVLDYLLPLAQAVNQSQLVTYHYLPAYSKEARVYQGQPIALYFETTYFYVIVQLRDRPEPRRFRLDRFASVDSVTKGDPHLTHNFSLRQYREEVMLLQAGERLTFRFKSTVPTDVVLDDFPTARVLSTDDAGVQEIEATSYMAGAKMWLLSQGAHVTVTSPASLVAEMQRETAALAGKYVEKA